MADLFSTVVFVRQRALTDPQSVIVDIFGWRLNTKTLFCLPWSLCCLFVGLFSIPKNLSLANKQNKSYLRIPILLRFVESLNRVIQESKK